MPFERSTSEQLTAQPIHENWAAQVDEQINRLCKHQLLRGSLRPHLLRYLIDVQRAGRYSEIPKPTGKQILSEFYEHAATMLGAAGPGSPESGKKLISDLIRALNDYYSKDGPGANDETIITIPIGKGLSYEPSFARRPSSPLLPESGQFEEIQAYRKYRHHYYLTKDRRGNPIWIYVVLNFRSTESGRALLAQASVVPDSRENRMTYIYEFEGSLDHGNLLLKTCRSGSASDVAIQLFSKADTYKRQLYGMRLGVDTWGGELASSISILSEVVLVPDAKDGEPVAHSEALQTYWDIHSGLGAEQAVIFARLVSQQPIAFHSCFISYSSHDQAFAERLHADLRAKNLRCWFAPEDLKIGDRFQESIEESIQRYDKVVIVLTASSVQSRWVEREVQAAREREDRENRTVLFPIRLDDTAMNAPQPWAADIRRTRHIGDFRAWEDRASYAKALERLLRDLQSVPVKRV